MRASVSSARRFRKLIARRATGDAVRGIARPGQEVVVIGDAAKAGKSKPAIASAFEAALLG